MARKGLMGVEEVVFGGPNAQVNSDKVSALG